MELSSTLDTATTGVWIDPIGKQVQNIFLFSYPFVPAVSHPCLIGLIPDSTDSYISKNPPTFKHGICTNSTLPASFFRFTQHTPTTSLHHGKTTTPP